MHAGDQIQRIKVKTNYLRTTTIDLAVSNRGTLIGLTALVRIDEN